MTETRRQEYLHYNKPLTACLASQTAAQHKRIVVIFVGGVANTPNMINHIDREHGHAMNNIGSLTSKFDFTDPRMKTKLCEVSCLNMPGLIHATTHFRYFTSLRVWQRKT